ncbi:MAG: hypothetical protein JJU26_10210 [Oceanicaulis sp.]|uniref:hypothetical protein n=1 Tax=Glycocaulis sp. TaxID=1969725 RepID=UPI0025C71D8F|nr:hypothetical protein [Glycocaulis sp.]MCC5982078.1 hypothetical protein [Oceanicaulis sp.]MCH8521820.1 hypothetical protein [Glycocaulis sp.]
MIDPLHLKMQWALSYPFTRPEGDFLFVDGRTLDIRSTKGSISGWQVVDGGHIRSLADVVGAERAKRLDEGAYHPVVAVGSNAAPVQLQRKFSAYIDDVVIPVIAVQLPGHVICWANRIAAYGSVPATLAGEPGASVSAWATLLSPRDYALMNATEDLGVVYEAVPVKVEGAPEAVHGPFEAYRCLTGHFDVRVSAFTATNSNLPQGNQWTAQELAISRLDLETPVDRFVAETVSDLALAAQRDRALSNS